MDKIETMWCQYTAPCWQKNQAPHWVQADTCWLATSETTWIHSEPTNNDSHFYNSLLFYPVGS